MRVTEQHARFWLQHRGPTWARMAIAPNPRYAVVATVHHCINGHVEPSKESRRKSFDVPNTVALIVAARRLRGKGHGTEYDSDRAYVAHLAGSPHSNPRRRGSCVKWLRRLERGAR